MNRVLEQDQEFEAREWPFELGPRMVRMWVTESPGGIRDGPGLMLCLHNWGGIYDQEIYRGWCETFSADSFAARQGATPARLSPPLLACARRPRALAALSLRARQAGAPRPRRAIRAADGAVV